MSVYSSQQVRQLFWGSVGDRGQLSPVSSCWSWKTSSSSTSTCPGPNALRWPPRSCSQRLRLEWDEARLSDYCGTTDFKLLIYLQNMSWTLLKVQFERVYFADIFDVIQCKQTLLYSTNLSIEQLSDFSAPHAGHDYWPSHFDYFWTNACIPLNF